MSELVNEIPSVLFKYKSIRTLEDLDRLMDAVCKRRLYLPTIAELNDPFEGCSTIVNGAWAGCSMLSAIGELQQPMRETLDLFRVCSLSARYDSPQMWAHYGDGFCGVCLAISTRRISLRCQKVEYSDAFNNVSAERLEASGESLQSVYKDIAEQSLLRKMMAWSYEDEWRVIALRDEEGVPYLDLGEDGIPFVIVGQNMRRGIKKALASICVEEGITLFQTHQMPQKHRVVPVPLDMKLRYDGSTLFAQIKDFNREYDLKSVDEFL